MFEEKDKKEIKNLKSRVPFAVVGSNTLIEPASGDGKRIRGRKYPWGVVDVSCGITVSMGAIHKLRHTTRSNAGLKGLIALLS